MKLSLPPDRSLGFQTRRCHRAFDRLLNIRLSSHGLTSGIYYFLRALWQEDGITQRRLCELNHITEPTASRTRDVMAKAGLVALRPDAADKRKLQIFLTKKGRDLEKELLPYAIDINSVASEDIPPSDLQICLRVLRQMSRNLSNELKAAQDEE